MKEIIYFDMDGVLADFESGLAKVSEEVKKEYEGRLDEIPRLFSLMDPIPGAIEFPDWDSVLKHLGVD